MENIKEQKPYTTSQVEVNKPSAMKSGLNPIPGYMAHSFNAGHNKTVHYKRILPGEKHASVRFSANFQLLTPLTPAYQRLKATVRAIFVPDSRVWKNSEKFWAQNGGTSEVKITSMPNLYGKRYPIIEELGDDGVKASIQDTTLWRNCWLSSYLPRQSKLNTGENTNALIETKLGDQCALKLRGRVAIYNDLLRNKEFDQKIEEYDSDNVTDTEWDSYFAWYEYGFNYFNGRAKRENSYYTNFRTELQGFEETYPPENMSADESLINWMQFEQKYAEAKFEAEEAQSNAWEVMAKMFGSKVLTEGKVQIIGKKTFDLNYSAITQNAYNTNSEIEPEFQVMGKQGAYSYTNIDIPLYGNVEFKEPGYIHIIINVTADTVYETAYDRLEMNVRALDVFRPELVELKDDVLYDLELGTFNKDTTTKNAIGFKRRYSEYFKAPDCISADMNSLNWWQWTNGPNENGSFFKRDEQIIGQSTYQFFELSADYTRELKATIQEFQYLPKNIWMDYSDLQLNKNQAIRNSVTYIPGAPNHSYTLEGQNQIIMVGAITYIADLPIPEEIKNNYTTWGSH